MAIRTIHETVERARGRSSPCAHVHVDVLGVSRAATYLRCRCGALLVGQDGEAWVIGTAFP